MCVVGVVLWTQVVPAEGTSACFVSLLATAYVRRGKRNTVNPEPRTIRHCSAAAGFAWTNHGRVVKESRENHWHLSGMHIDLFENEFKSKRFRVMRANWWSDWFSQFSLQEVPNVRIVRVTAGIKVRHTLIRLRIINMNLVCMWALFQFLFLFLSLSLSPSSSLSLCHSHMHLHIWWSR